MTFDAPLHYYYPCLLRGRSCMQAEPKEKKKCTVGAVNGAELSNAERLIHTRLGAA